MSKEFEYDENLQLAENDSTLEDVVENLNPNEYESKRELLKKTKIVRQTWSILEIFQKIRDVKLILDPDYQRREIWGGDKKTAFIESLFMDIMIPPIYVVEIPGDDLLAENKYEVVDGKQRLTAIKEFLEGKLYLQDKALEYYNDLFKNKNFNTIKEEEPEKVTQVLSSILDIYVITANSPEFTKYDIFARLNKGAEKLKVNEIRRAIYRSKVSAIISDYIEEHLSEKYPEKKANYVQVFSTNDIKRFEDYGRFYRTLAFYMQSDSSSYQVREYNSRPREMINTVLHKFQKGQYTLSNENVTFLLDKTLELKNLLKEYEYDDYLIDACAPFLTVDTYESLVSNLDQIIKDGIILETFKKSPATTKNINDRLKRVCEIMGAQ